MVVRGSQQETLDTGFVLLGTRQKGAHVILRELALPGRFDPVTAIDQSLIDICAYCYMVVGGSRQETLDLGFVLLGTRQQRVSVILREMVLSGGFNPISPSFTVREVTTELSGP
ncbi:unnamed protein product [Schistosoma margrebowiei]|uniref:Uncharacterized protein n=1 Tax=Schistosoma margrebowiei TaxID=48269 RepID=A0A183LJ22_9TREM|nr:unnamed protein product [Schistosoma margrebowiei]